MRLGRSRNVRPSCPASPSLSGCRSTPISDVWEWPPCHRATLEGRKLAFTSIASGQQARLGAGLRPHLNFAHLIRVRQQPPELPVIMLRPFKAGAPVCRSKKNFNSSRIVSDKLVGRQNPKLEPETATQSRYGQRFPNDSEKGRTVSKRSGGVAGIATAQMSHGKIYESYEEGLAAHPGSRLGVHAQFCSQCAGWHAEPNTPTPLFPAKA
jgi:hypothetical protein